MSIYFNPKCAVIIDNHVIYQNGSGICSSSIKSLINKKVDLRYLPGIPRISLGSRLLDNELLAKVTSLDNDNILTVENLIKKYQPQNFGVNIILFPDLCPETKKKRIKVRQTQRIKRELLETSAKICMNPARIQRLLENNIINLDDIESLYNL